MATTTPLRWGFIGCGKISSDFANAMKNLPSAVFHACAARSLDSAAAFAKTHGFAKHYDSYEALCADADVDVVYIGTLHVSHYEHTLLALRHGKHVLVEKPMAMNATQASHVVSEARERQLFLMEGMWTRFFPAVRHVRALLAAGTLGEVRHVNAAFGVAFQPDADRIWKKALGGGGLLDIGIYPLAFVSMVMGYTPERVTAVGSLTANECVDQYASITLEYADHKLATVQYSCLAEMDETVTVTGTKGRVVIETPAHAPTKVRTTLFGQDSTERNHDLLVFPHPEVHANATAFNFGGSNGFLYEAQAVTEAIQAKQTEQSEYPLQESLGIMGIMDDVRRQLGLVYDADAQ